MGCHACMESVSGNNKKRVGTRLKHPHTQLNTCQFEFTA